MNNLVPEITAFKTAFGWCAILGRAEQLSALAFAQPTAEAAMKRALQGSDEKVRLGNQRGKWNRTLAERIVATLEGEPDDYRDVEIDLEQLTPFSRRVVAAVRRIGWGQTASYGEIARMAGSAGAARAVGSVMASNRTPLIVPCHRVIASGRKIGGFSAPTGIRMKKRLLALEGAMANLSVS
jgi:methylated-DNA-[protein]-cysteine S-methyltransferase